MPLVSQEERERPYKNMEQRLAAYRQECEARLQYELHMQASECLLHAEGIAWGIAWCCKHVLHAMKCR